MSQTKHKRYELRCKSDPKVIGRVESFLHEMNQTVRLDDGTFYRVLVATTEAVNNAIQHGNEYDPLKDVIVVCFVASRTLKIQVKDEGKGFDVRKVPDPLDEKNLLKEHGRGVFLMTSMTDKVKYRRLKKGMVVEMMIDLKHLD